VKDNLYKACVKTVVRNSILDRSLMILKSNLDTTTNQVESHIPRLFPILVLLEYKYCQVSDLSGDLI